ncbi:MAG: hypothetical protein A2754_03760 [Candidatus Magasanikbacteria bacterium RIFCSPHIGHO2_01_FULL_47_8]|uniref:Uncharacterized protein n=1 Tax=Candidatus Magasanikbacteria bacterium RIFCSPHIGHO2_01_FULL_47_8 TaxID=1798673 RepID=A0A1F6MCZ4_9BACT|nr:MAG: hypothetical protein A2754_03760 [Candidatus Magasanikbacteria bacterium RIFCSPHIGHO2_01_FULL_47_8]
MIASNDLRQIRNLSNGELEGLFNNVLRAVTEGQRQVALSLFYSLLYSPDKLNSYRSAEAGERVRQHRFLAKELANVRAQSVERTVPTAHNFMESLTDFVKRAQKMEPDREQLYADLHSVLDLVHNDLTEKEQALLETAFTYLEAKQMKKGEKE